MRSTARPTEPCFNRARALWPLLLVGPRLLGCSSGDDSGQFGASVNDGSISTTSTTSSGDSSSTNASSSGTTGQGAVSSATTGGSTATATTSGSTGAGGAASTSMSTTGMPVETDGCGATSWPEAGPQTLDVDGTMREFIVALPDGYDANAPQRLVFAFHGRTGTAEQIASGFGGGYYGLSSRMQNTIFVAPQGLGTDEDPSDTGWPNSGGQDIAFVEAMLAHLESSYCVDAARIFSVGFSYGGIMSNTIACQMGSRFRAVAPMAGALFSFGQNACIGEPVAAWFTHGSADTTITPDQGESARDALLATNGCEMTTTPVEPSPCVEYACPAQYPVHWCLHDGAHTLPDFAGDAVAAFFERF